MQAPTARLRARSALAVVLAGACALVPLRASATEGQDFEAARDAYVGGEYERAVQLFESMVGGETPAIHDDVLVRESRKYLAAAYVLTGQRDLGARQFEFLLRSQGIRIDGYDLDRAAFPREVLEVFDGVRQELLRQRDQERAIQTRLGEEEEQRRREATLRLLDLAQHDEVVIQHDPALAWIPLGVGQFQNGDAALGAFFLSSELVALATAVAGESAYVLLETQHAAAGPTSTIDPGVLRGLEIANWVSIGALAALAVAGVIEAHINFVPSHTVRRERDIPPDVLEGLDLSVGPTGFSLRLRF